MGPREMGKEIKMKRNSRKVLWGENLSWTGFSIPSLCDGKLMDG